MRVLKKTYYKTHNNIDASELNKCVKPLKVYDINNRMFYLKGMKCLKKNVNDPLIFTYDCYHELSNNSLTQIKNTLCKRLNLSGLTMKLLHYKNKILKN